VVIKTARWSRLHIDGIVIARRPKADAAIQGSSGARRSLDCFAPLAMTSLVF
jgi:hypothetical protein